MIFDRLANTAEIFAGWSQVASGMSAREGIGGEHQAVDHKKPGEEQVPLPPIASHLALGIVAQAGKPRLMPSE